MQARLPVGAAALTACLVLTVPALCAEPPVQPEATQPEESRESTLARREAAQQAFVRRSEEERYEEAVAIAAEIVQLTTRLYGEKSVELAGPLTNLGTAQMRHGDLAAAETSYHASIAIIEAEEGVTSSRLINPLVGLGETYMRGGLYQQANATYRRALQTNHVQSGFYNLEQDKILDGLSESYLALEKIGQANAQQRIQVDIQRRRSGAESPEAIAAMQKLGRWYNRTGQYSDARMVFQDAQRLLRESKSTDSTAMVDAMLGEAVSYENEGAGPPSASVIKRALAVLEEQPDPDPLKRAEVLVALGDLYIMSAQPRAGRERYEQAWRQLSGNDELLAQRDRYFAKPAQISGPLLPDIVGADGKAFKPGSEAPRGLADGFVVASMTIDADGDVLDPAIVESSPPGLMDRHVLRALAFAVFRPRMIDGAVVQSDGLQFRHDYRYPQPAPAVTESPLPDPGDAGASGAPIRYPDDPDD